MAKKKDFKLNEDLETLVQLTGASTHFKDESRFGVNKRLRIDAQRLHSQLSSLGASRVPFTTLRAVSSDDFEDIMAFGEGQAYKALESRIDPTVYSEARAFYLGKLDIDMKAQFYSDMLRRGIMPDKPDAKAKKDDKDSYALLEKLQKEVHIMDALEVAIKKGDMDAAKKISVNYLDVEDLGILGIMQNYGAPVFREAEKNIYLDVVNVRRTAVRDALKDGKLYGLIDAGIAKHKQGRAHSLVGMYNAYQLQQHLEEEKAKAEKATKKK